MHSYSLSALKSGDASALQSMALAVGGSLLLALMSQLEIPIGPVPYTLQTMGVFLLGLCLGPRRAAYACLLYLAEASMGLPVLSHWRCNPLWRTGPCAGYLLSFPAAAYLSGRAAAALQPMTFFKGLLSVLTGQLVLFGGGVLWLSAFVGLADAIAWGLTPFVVTDLLKGAIAVALYLSWHRLKGR